MNASREIDVVINLSFTNESRDRRQGRCCTLDLHVTYIIQVTCDITIDLHLIHMSPHLIDVSSLLSLLYNETVNPVNHNKQDP